MKKFSMDGHCQTSRLPLFDQGHISKLAPGRVGCFFPRHASGDQFIDLSREVLLNLSGEIAVETAA
jgi:hypothetical protein